MPVMPPMPVRRNTLPSREELLRATCRGFCQELSEGRSTSQLLDLFFIPDNPKIKEHGPVLPKLPFLGVTFSGRRRGGGGGAGGDKSSPQAVELDGGAGTSSLAAEESAAAVVEGAALAGERKDGSTCEDYFDILASIFEFIPSVHGFAGASQFVVDITVPSTDPDLYRGMRNEGNGVVCVTSKGTFKSVETGKQWDEEIIYKFSGFDDEGKIGQWEIWADTLSAWAAIH